MVNWNVLVPILLSSITFFGLVIGGIIVFIRSRIRRRKKEFLPYREDVMSAEEPEEK